MFLLPYLLKVSLLLAVLTLAYRWLIQFETFSKVNRVLLWLNVAAAWALPLIPLATWGPTEVQQRFHRTLPAIAQAIPSASLSVPAQSPVPTLLPAEAVDAWGMAEWLLLLYGIGVAYMAFRFLFRLGRLVRSIWRRPTQPLENGLVLVLDENTASPYSFFCWIVLNPKQYALPESRQILAHETEHARQGHSFDLLLAEIQRIALWFNPFAWIHQQLVQSNLEYLADEAVLTHGFAKKSYQITLLHAVLRTNEPPLTNSFAQSLLKKRIKMMNRKPSRRLAWGKYALLIATLYVSAAFVAPYQKQIVKMTPAPLQPMVSVLVPESVPSVGEPEEEVKVAEPEKVTIVEEESEKVTESDVAKKVKSKWVQVQGDTLHWSIPATATLTDIDLIAKDVAKYGGQLSINALRYDPKQLFLTALMVAVKQEGNSGMGGPVGTDIYTPIKGFWGYILKNGKGLGVGWKPPQPLENKVDQDYQKAQALAEENQNDYFEHKFIEDLRSEKINAGSRGYSKESLLGKSADRILEVSGIGKSGDKLIITQTYRESDFYINTKPSTFEQVNSISFDKFENVNIIDDRNGKKYFMIYTR